VVSKPALHRLLLLDRHLLRGGLKIKFLL
jgi:hypothetical protein